MEELTVFDIRDYINNENNKYSVEDCVKAIFAGLDKMGRILGLCYHVDSDDGSPYSYPYDKTVYELDTEDGEDTFQDREISEEEKTRFVSECLEDISWIIATAKKLGELEYLKEYDPNAPLDERINLREKLCCEGKLTYDEASFAVNYLEPLTESDYCALENEGIYTDVPAEEGHDRIEEYRKTMTVVAEHRLGWSRGFDALEVMRRVQYLYRATIDFPEPVRERMIDVAEKYVAEAWTFFNCFHRITISD